MPCAPRHREFIVCVGGGGLAYLAAVSWNVNGEGRYSYLCRLGEQARAVSPMEELSLPSSPSYLRLLNRSCDDDDGAREACGPWSSGREEGREGE